MRSTIRSKSPPTVVDAEAAGRRRIVTEARRHFLAHGFRGVTMDDLAAELGMSKKTLYAHFSSKDSLLEAVIEDKLRAVDLDLGRVASESANTETRLTISSSLCRSRRLRGKSR